MTASKKKLVVDAIRNQLNSAADEKLKISSQRYFKEEVKVYGIRAAEVSRMAKESFNALDDKSKTSVFSCCELFWKSGMLEETFIACNWAYAVRKQFTEADITIFEAWIDKYITNWASCDTFCNHTLGEIMVRFPELTSYLQKWAVSDNRWMRRASAVSLIVPARKGLFLPLIFQLADTLLMDKDDMVQKGYGWMLKSASQARQQEVYEFVMANKTRMPRTALRYAIEKMPEAMRKEALKK